MAKATLDNLLSIGKETDKATVEGVEGHVIVKKLPARFVLEMKESGDPTSPANLCSFLRSGLESPDLSSVSDDDILAIPMSVLDDLFGAINEFNGFTQEVDEAMNTFQG